MSVAVVTDDNKTISPHFGRATHYAVITVEEGRVTARELREKAGHRDFQREGLEGHRQHQDDVRGRGFGIHSEEKHRRMRPKEWVHPMRGSGQRRRLRRRRRGSL